MTSSPLTRGLVALAAFVIFIAGLRAASSLIVPFLLATFLAVITSPLMVQFKKWGVGSGISILLILLMVLGILWMILQVAGASINEFTRASEDYQIRLRGITREWAIWLRSKGIDTDSETLNSFFNPANTMRVVVNTLTTFITGILTNTFLILLTTVFLLFELAGLPNKLRLAFGEDHPSVPGWERFTESLNRYLAIKSIVSLLTGITAYTLVRILGIDFALLWGILAFMFNYVPNIGSIMAAVPPVMLSLVQYGTGRALACLLGYVVINLVYGNLIEPRVMGKGLGLSTLVVWMSLIFWGWVFGPVGMLLSVPLTMVVKIAMESKADTMWLAILLGSDPGAEAKGGPS